MQMIYAAFRATPTSSADTDDNLTSYADVNTTEDDVAIPELNAKWALLPNTAQSICDWSSSNIAARVANHVAMIRSRYGTSSLSIRAKSRERIWYFSDWSHCSSRMHQGRASILGCLEVVIIRHRICTLPGVVRCGDSTLYVCLNLLNSNAIYICNKGWENEVYTTIMQ